MKAYVNSHEILKKAGLKSMKTLTRWHQRGLIPPPDIRNQPEGRGRLAYWPDWVLERCIRIRRLVQAGRSLDEIARMLGDDWEEAEKTYKKRYRLKDATAVMDRDVCIRTLQDITYQSIFDFLAKAKTLIAPRSRGVSGELVLRAVELTLDGHNPILVSNGEELNVVPDFLVSQILADSFDDGEPMLAIPLFRDVRRTFESVEPKLPQAPTIRPRPQVVQGDYIATFEKIGDTDYAISEKRKQRRKKKKR